MMGKGIEVRGWRIGVVEPDGLSCYFDPLTERVEVHLLTEEDKLVIVDMVGSVSALGEGEGLREVYEQGRFEFDYQGDPHG